MKYLIIGLLTMMCSFSFGENANKNLKVEFEPLSFQKVATSETTKDKIMAKGYITISVDGGLDTSAGETYNSLLVIKLPETAYLTNTNHPLKIENINVAYSSGDSEEKKIATIEHTGKQFTFNGTAIILEVSGIVDREQINSQLENVEGLYTGTIPIEIQEYVEEN